VLWQQSLVLLSFSFPEQQISVYFPKCALIYFCTLQTCTYRRRNSMLRSSIAISSSKLKWFPSLEITGSWYVTSHRETPWLQLLALRDVGFNNWGSSLSPSSPKERWAVTWTPSKIIYLQSSHKKLFLRRTQHIICINTVIKHRRLIKFTVRVREKS
jgi:hypothetical protein